MQIETRSLDEIVPYSQNPKSHQVEWILNSIKIGLPEGLSLEDERQYIVNTLIAQPIVVDGDGVIIKGHGRLKAAKELGLTAFPVVVRTDLTPDQVRLARIADNRSQEGGWEIETLEQELADLVQRLPDVDFEDFGINSDWCEDLGFELEEFGESDDESDLDILPPEPVHVVIQSGDLIEFPGGHRFLCGDCTEQEVVDRVMGGERARYGMHDPPYGINVVAASDRGGSKPFGSIGFNGVMKTNAYEPVIGDDKPFNPLHLLEVSQDCILWGANYYADKLPPKKGWIVWDKKGREGWRDNFSDCELVWSSLPIVTKIFRHTWMGMVQEGEREKRIHPTQKPVALFKKIISELLLDEGLVVDFYLGSGTTLIACEKLHRRCYGIEISPQYVQVCVQRFVDYTGNPEITINGKVVNWRQYKNQ